MGELSPENGINQYGLDKNGHKWCKSSKNGSRIGQMKYRNEEKGTGECERKQETAEVNNDVGNAEETAFQEKVEPTNLAWTGIRYENERRQLLPGLKAERRKK